jgi:peptidoglycan/LPS O-acetylase OafA/YrhL
MEESLQFVTINSWCHGPVDTNNHKDNNFGLLRLLFAALVVISHSPELVDGDRSREILTQVFGTMSFGEFAVDGFFLISGYLITKSFIQSTSIESYLLKRFLRIYPAYLVSFWVCALIIAPFVGGEGSVLSIIGHGILRMLSMSPPEVPGAFRGLHCAELPVLALNGSMWTILYEFLCYLATMVLGLLNMLETKNRALLLALVGVLLLLNATGVAPSNMANIVRFGAVYGVGALYYLFRDNIRLTNGGALVAVALLIALFPHSQLAEAALAICGGYLIFWFAFKVRVLRLSRAVTGTDISYGLYLYAWPIQNLVIWTNRSVNPWLVSCITLLAASLVAYASWTLVEKPCLRLARIEESPPHR